MKRSRIDLAEHDVAVAVFYWVWLVLIVVGGLACTLDWF